METRKIAAPMPGASLPIPQVSIQSTPAPGKRGPVGTSPRQNNSVVNTGVPSPSSVGLDAKTVSPNTSGMLPQKQALPSPLVPTIKVSEVFMGSMAARPTVQDMIKAAMNGAASRADIHREAGRQAENLGEKTAAAETPRVEKTAAYDRAMQLADAVEHIASDFVKAANEVGKGPGALTVTESKGGPSLPDHKGQSHQAIPMHSAEQKSSPKGPANQMKNDMDSPAGFHGHQQASMVNQKGGSKHASILAAFNKVASEKSEKDKEEVAAEEKKEDKAPEKTEKKASLVDGLRLAMTKAAEDAINPAHISAGKADPPDTRASGESGGPSPAGASMVGSNESAINLTKGQAKAAPKSDLKAYVQEPALTSSTDSVLQAAFAHTGEAGTKFASAGPSEKTAAAKALLQKIADAASEKE